MRGDLASVVGGSRISTAYAKGVCLTLYCGPSHSVCRKKEVKTQQAWHVCTLLHACKGICVRVCVRHVCAYVSETIVIYL